MDTSAKVKAVIRAGSRFTTRDDACCLSRANAQACLTSWPIAQSRGGISYM